ncbi:hypothetical protein N656DRAFT_712412 [Canariomyces notabilis]|uniref:Rhodopsin domain-containing protein n=1 Tax=Canariomyces notabilis TaxID=2074819 RepID=A0AAN6YQF4_9PEZI|nr:hypothetical protein N656DRAFT_712412 [Canariomyces arenarius]
MNSLFDHGNSQFVKTNIATWILTCASGAFLFFRVWCRIRFSRLSWDDYVLTTSWFILFVACILLSRALATGYETDADKRAFYIFHHASTSMSAIAIAWTKVAFAITLIRIVQNPGLRGVLWAIILTANLVLVLGMLSIWIPACEDARAIYRPVQGLCFSLRDTQYLGGTTIVYGGVIDVVLALLPWLVIRKLLLDMREKIGLTVAMSLGALTGAVVICRAFFQFIMLDNDFEFMAFLSIFNFLEPAVTIIAQTIPVFRVLLARFKWGPWANNGRRRGASTTDTYARSGPREMQTWNGRPNRWEDDQEMLHNPVSPAR